MAAKTPYQVLLETCVKHGILPKFDLTVDGVDGPGNTRIFTYVGRAFGIFAEGTGTSKQSAKHDTAEKLMEQLKTLNIDAAGLPAMPPKSEPKNDSVSELTNLCVTENWPVPQFTPLERSGPPHQPVFTMMCSVGKHSANGQCSTKKGAKNRAAHMVLEAIKEAKANVPDVPVIEEFIPEPLEDVTAKYLRLTKRTQKKIRGRKMTLSNRHRYFQSFDDGQIDEATRVLEDLQLDDDELSAREKVQLVLNIFNMTYKLSDFSMRGQRLKLFELDGDYDVVFVGSETDIWDDIVRYLKHMLNIVVYV